MEGIKGYYCQELLLQELESRKAKNSMYSLRAFARDLGIGSTSLSDALASKRKLSKTNILKIAEKLEWDSSKIDLLLSEIKRGKGASSRAELEQLQLEEDSLRLIADWYYYAILNLAKLKKNKSCPSWIAKRLSISVKDADKAIDRLVRMGLIKLQEGKIIRTSNAIVCATGIPSNAKKKHHRDKLKLAEKSLILDNIESRDFSSITMAVNPNKINDVRDILYETRQRIAEIMETDDATEVYNLSIQLFSLTKEEETT